MIENPSVYVVFRYHYPDLSDCEIIAVLTSKEGADKYVKHMNPSANNSYGSGGYEYVYDWSEFELID